VLLESGINYEKFSPIIFDISSQLDLDAKLYDYLSDNSTIEKELRENFENISNIFNRDVEIIESQINPIRSLRGSKDFLLFVPFDKELLEPKLLTFFYTKFSSHYDKLDSNYQLFMPMD